MKIKINTFGSLTDLMDQEFYVEASDTDGLLSDLCKKYQALNGRKLLLAVNNTIVQSNQTLAENDVVALMPPYSGG